MRILLSAYACGPGLGSEPGVGWNWARHAANFHDVWVLTRANNKPDIDAALMRDPQPRLHFVYFDLPAWARWWKRGQHGIHLYYYLWQIGAYRVARRLHARLHFDVIHHLTIGVYWMPSPLALLPAPFIWGPVGGAERTPPRFMHLFNWRGRIFELARSIARKLGEFDPLVRLTARRAALVLAKTPDTANRAQALGSHHVEIVSEAAICESELALMSAYGLRPGRSLVIVSVGRLVHLKGFALGLRAFARFLPSSPKSEYWIVGDGSERARLERLASELGVSGRVVFCGALPRSQVLDLLAQCDVLLHPSLHESGGWVCLEAMAAGRPVVCLDLGGPATQVTNETGIKVAANDPEQSVEDLAAALTTLAQDPKRRLQMGTAARRRVLNEFTWPGKGDIWHTIAEESALAGTYSS